MEGPTATTLAHPTNIAFKGDKLYTANLGRWHITEIDLAALARTTRRPKTPGVAPAALNAAHDGSAIGLSAASNYPVRFQRTSAAWLQISISRRGAEARFMVRVSAPAKTPGRA